jgi:hypothetical protein
MIKILEGLIFENIALLPRSHAVRTGRAIDLLIFILLIIMVTGTLSDAKQLRGGVIFLSEIPVTASTKVHRRKLKEIVSTMVRE